MTLAESGHSSGVVSLKSLFDGVAPDGFDPEWTPSRGRRLVAERIVAGGWPETVSHPVDIAAEANGDYLSLITEYDLPALAGGRKDPLTAARVVRSYARHIATPAAASTIAADISGDGDGPGVDATSRDSVRTHLDALTRLRIVEEQPAWAPALRSSRRARTTAKRHFVDPCLAAAALGVGPDRLEADSLTLGLWFESLVVRDLRCYAQPLGGKVYGYRDSGKLEVDIIVELRDGRWGAIEVKVGSAQAAIAKAADSLTELTNQVDPSRCAFRAIVTAGGRARRRADGIDIIPIPMLGP
jgi:predicted AAA+ superfamily ATPase